MEVPTKRQAEAAFRKEFLRRFRRLIFHTWNIPPIFGLTFILVVGVLTPAQLLVILDYVLAVCLCGHHSRKSNSIHSGR